MMKKYQLRNGMKVLLIESKKSPVISVQVWVKTGSADERKGEEGLSHFIEHLVFKGTRKFKVGEVAAAIETAGGEINAYTSFDQTVFHVTLSKHFLDTGLDVISEMVAFPLFDEKEINAEREVVIEEIKKNADDPHRQSSRLLFETVFKTHPYSLPVIGYESVIRKVPKKKILEYYHTRYVPSNMTLIVVGDFEAKDIQKKIKEKYESIEPLKLRKVSRLKEKKQDKPRLTVKPCSFEESYFNIAWRVPPPDHKSIPALEILGLVLGQGDSSRLVKAARIDKPVVNSVGAGIYTPRDGGFFVVSASMNSKNLAEYLEILKSKLSEVLREPPSAEEFQKTITNFESEEFYSLETVDGLARKAGYYNDLMGDPDYFKNFMKQVLAVKPADIVKTARQYFNPKQMSLTLMDNGKAGEAKKLLSAWMKQYAEIYKKASKEKIVAGAKVGKKKSLKWGRADLKTGKMEKIILPSGATLILRPSFDTPTISARAAFCGGTRIEADGKDGLVELFSNVWLAGAGELKEEEIYLKTESLATSLSAFGGRNSVGLSLETLAPFESQALDLFSEVLTKPLLPKYAVEREKTSMLEAIRAKEDYPAQLAVQQFLEGLFRRHPYAKELSGKATTVPGLTEQEVQSYWKQVSMARNLIVAVGGHFDIELWKKRIEEASQNFKAGQRIQNNFPHEAPTEAVSLYRKLEKEQTHIIVGYKGLTQNDPSRFALQILQSVLAGQGGRLFIELRDKASLAYSVSPIRMEGIDTGYFGGYIACSPSKVEQAIQMLIAEFKRLADHLVSETELDRAKRYVVGRHDIELQKNSAICAAMLFDDMYGNSFDESFRYSEIVKGVTREDIRTLAQKLFGQKPVFSVVGPNPPKSVEARPAGKVKEQSL
jgi:zinc protease